MSATRLLALAAILWMLACWAGFVYCLVIWQPALAFGLAFASIIPAILDGGK